MSPTHYDSKNKYEGNLSSLGTGVAFAVVGAASLVLRAYDQDFIGLSSWGYWMFVPAFFMIAGSIGQYSTDQRLKREMLVALRARGPGRHDLKALVEELAIKPKYVRRILLDLRAAGLISYGIDGTTGEIVLAAVSGASPAGQAPSVQVPVGVATPTPSLTQQQATTTAAKRFCEFCGSPVSPGAKYCESCGTKI
ncbi:MAG: hypothetical protein Kow0069_17280 [Promethearchaeota archaeon]